MNKTTLKAPIRFGLSMIMLLLLVDSGIYSAGLLRRNVGDLIRLSDLIVVGKIVNVTDGFEGKLPYTEVTVEVSESIVGSVENILKFRQFGLMAPRQMSNGKTNLNVAPDGWPRFTKDQQVLLFLYNAAARTGLRTTVGLFQGKFDIMDGNISNAVRNSGLFDKLSVDQGKLTRGEQAMIKQLRGPVDARTFISFVRKAVAGQWFR